MNAQLIDYGINGKRALITGGSHGIGLAIAKTLAQSGCDIFICSRTAERLQHAAQEISELAPSVRTYQLDALNPDDIKGMMAEVDKVWGGVDILINNVGGGGRWGLENIEETPEDVWGEVYQKNTGIAIDLTRWAIPRMRQQKWGRVVTIASVLGKEAGGRPWFTMAKSAQISMMKTLARTPYLVRDGITFNTVSPGGIMIPDTGWEEMERDEPQKYHTLMDQSFPLGRLGTPQEVAHTVHFLCSRQASLVNGTCICVDGGESHAF